MQKHTAQHDSVNIDGRNATSHFEQRAASRQLTEDQIQFALLFGTPMHCGGRRRAYIVRHQNIPCDMDAKLARRYHGTVVITDLDGFTLVTAYQNPHAYTKMKKKFRN